jgi:hypothetical protein
MSAAADEDDVVFGLWLWLAPHRLPAGIAFEGLGKDGEDRIAQESFREAGDADGVEGSSPS